MVSRTASSEEEASWIHTFPVHINFCLIYLYKLLQAEDASLESFSRRRPYDVDCAPDGDWSSTATKIPVI